MGNELINIKLEVKKFLAINNISIDEFCSKIGIGRGGYFRMLQSNSTKRPTLERMSEVMNVPMSFWYQEEQKDEEKVWEDFMAQAPGLELRDQLQNIAANRNVEYVPVEFLNRLLEQWEQDKKACREQITALLELLKDKSK